jgi:PHD/YefM family antitoxin component YafN of YafNO toxin-antitoxin module
MTASLPLASSSEVSKRFGYYYDEAMTYPVGIERNGVARVVMLSMSEYQRLALLDHVATASSEMPDEDYKALRDARVSDESVALNALMD